jgi:hypothetical protein
MTFVDTLAESGTELVSRLFDSFVWVSFAAIVGLALLIKVLFRAHAASSIKASAGRASRATIDWRRLPFDLLLWLAFASVPAQLLGLRPLEALLDSLARSPTSVLLLLFVVVGATLYVSHRNWAVRIAVGLAHAGVHLLTWLLIATGMAAWIFPLATPPASEPGILVQLGHLAAFGGWLVLSAALSGGISATLFGFYLWFAGRHLPEQLNDVFSAIGVEDFKNFVRLHIDSKGDITVHPVGVRRVPRQWMLNPTKDDEAPFLIPVEGEALTAELIEPPFRL